MRVESTGGRVNRRGICTDIVEDEHFVGVGGTPTAGLLLEPLAGLKPTFPPLVAAIGLNAHVASHPMDSNLLIINIPLIHLAALAPRTHPMCAHLRFDTHILLHLGRRQLQQSAQPIDLVMEIRVAQAHGHKTTILDIVAQDVHHLIGDNDVFSGHGDLLGTSASTSYSVTTMSGVGPGASAGFGATGGVGRSGTGASRMTVTPGPGSTTQPTLTPINLANINAAFARN
ncbi:hypothetical protein BDK51DRAFT_37630 [Blyttiomyces helicus]|uniref:Uncharacterized protein n=1 Tax=Blyttiomyces helicus TaxID=388810 RepID=A0A4P9WHH9_9FUNG|nr:hypothetical protein BDK51DRAFT_37630 [Blyttiomyces helicus]|eukprot:RKO91842.1 hypothetical protein BDK51DRAFT_37630 [Blyttiomyces helicus]